MFDFYAGTAKRAPQWWQDHSLEWLYRLLKEPKRMWKRYVLGNPLFVWNIVKEKLHKLNIVYDHFTHSSPVKRNAKNTLCVNSTADQKTIKKYYIMGNYSEYKCSICGQLPEWQGKPLTLILDHISGNNTDSRIENLRWVCPNCNQQLETTGFKKIRVKK